MIDTDDMKHDAGEPASKASDDARAAARSGDAFESADATDAQRAAAEASCASVIDPASADDAARDTQPAPHIGLLVLQQDAPLADKSQYHVAELTAYHDRRFVENVYKAILGRAPLLAERARELDELRGGRTGKVEIIERLSSSPEARASGRDVKIEGLPSPLMRRLGRVRFVGYALRLVRALVRLPVSMQHQQQFEIYALAQQQLIADYINWTLARMARGGGAAAAGDMSAPYITLSEDGEVAETLAMFSDALLELSNSHAEFEARTRTQMEQAQAALADLTNAITVQQQLAETLRREQQLAADAQQEFLIQEQRVIVETQKVVLEELREELRELSVRQQSAREEFDAEMRRLRSLQEEAAAHENFSGQA